MLDDMRITSFALRYYINPPEANCPTIYPTNPTTRLQKQGNSWPTQQWRTDVESDLKGINRFGQRIRCDKDLYNPETNAYNNMPLENAQDEEFPMKFNRLDNGPCTLRSTGWNRWQPLFHDPQKSFEQPFDYFIPARDVDKERYKSRPRAASPPAIPPYQPLADQVKYGPSAVPGQTVGVY